MRMLRFVSLLVVFSIICSPVSAQLPAVKTDPEKEKAALELEKNALELLDQAVTEAAALKLPENRALVFALAGDIIWSKDAKRGRELFREAVNNIIFIAGAAEDKSVPANPSETARSANDIFELRRMVLTALARYDAELAMEFLQTTRPPDVAAELQTYLSQVSETKTPATPNTVSRTTPQRTFQKAEQEIRLEQIIAARAAEQDPQKAAKMIRESLSKGVSQEVLPLIFKITEKDADLANNLLAEIFQKVSDSDYTKKRNEQNFALNLLRIFSQPRPPTPNSKSPLAKLSVDNQTLRNLAGKIADSLLKSTNYGDSLLFNSSMPVLGKIIPERIPQLKQKQAELRKQIPENVRLTQTPSSFYDLSAPAETLIAEAAKADPRVRGMMYQQAAMRALTNGDPEKVRALLQSLPKSKERDNAIIFLDSQLAEKRLAAGQFDEARKLIDRMLENNEKVEQIVRLAVASYKLNTKESKENAGNLMEEARQMVKDFPEDKDETDGLLKVVAGYAVIDAPRAFLLLAPVIEQANEVINASATLAKYNKQSQFFRDGEIVMATNFAVAGSKFFRYGKEMKLLAQADFGRTRGLIDQFRREDVRVFAKIFIAQGILKQRIGF